ncbi:MAG: oxygenase MpaB family protein [Pseudomonadota bacterium]
MSDTALPALDRTPVDILTLATGRDTPPSSFAYDRRAHSEEAHKVRSMIKRFMGEDTAPNPELAHEMGVGLWQGDALSDPAMMAIAAAGLNPHTVIERLLEGGLDALDSPPKEVVALWQQATSIPDWLDWETLEYGAEVYRRYGVAGFQFQGVATIPGYLNESIALTLMSTGQYADDTAFKRFLLTCNFWMETSDKGGMRPGAPGWKVAMQVRMLHSLIRRTVLKRPRWEAERLGMPISSTIMLGAPMISSYLLGQQMKILGYAASDDDIAAMMHLWRYIAYVMGVDDRHFPKSHSEAAQLLHDTHCLWEETTPDEGIQLSQSFMNAFRNRAKAQADLESWRDYHRAIAQSFFFVPAPVRKTVGTPDPRFWACLHWMTAFPRNRLIGALSYAAPAFNRWRDRRVSRRRRAWVERELNAASLVYRPQPKY